MKNKNLNKLFLILMCIQTILLAILFIVQLLRIYYGGQEPMYSREICGEYLLQILPAMIIWVVLIVISGIYFNINKPEKEKKSKIFNSTKLNNLLMIVNDPKSDLENYNSYKKYLLRRKIAWIINIVILVISSVMGILYIANTKHFELENPTNSIKAMTIHLLPWAIISLISFIACTIYDEYICKVLINHVKVMISSGGKKVKNINLENKKAIWIARGIILSVSIVFIIVGVINGGAQAILEKAINICTECIGLG